METSKWENKEFKSNYMQTYCKQYYEQRREMLCAKVTCSCGKQVNLSSLKLHMKSKLHTNRLLTKEELIAKQTNKLLNNELTNKF
jgi:hypothetical protein